MELGDAISVGTSFIIITLDSCRWDVFNNAKTDQLDTMCDFRSAFTHGTYTLPAHLSIYNGILPDVKSDLPYYNRFSKNLFRINARPIGKSSFVEFPKGTLNIIEGFRGMGYNCFGTGATRWFQHPILTEPYDDFYYSGIHFENQMDYILSKVKGNTGPYFLFVNIGETHEPYEFGSYVEESAINRARMRAFTNCGILLDEIERQKNCVEFLDSKIVNLIEDLKYHCQDLVAVICADHGECFGEDGFYGHGFYHEKVMEVPLGIFRV